MLQHQRPGVINVVKKAFLPEGWPQSVSEGVHSFGASDESLCQCSMYTLFAPCCMLIMIMWHACVLSAFPCTRMPGQMPACICHADYLSFQSWDTVQALSSYIRGLLTSQAVLKGVGVGQQVSTR